MNDLPSSTALYTKAETMRFLRLSREQVNAMLEAGTLVAGVVAPGKPVRVAGWSILKVLGLWETERPSAPAPVVDDDPLACPPDVDPIAWGRHGRYERAVDLDREDLIERPLRWICESIRERRRQGLPSLAPRRRIGRVARA